MKLRNGVFIAEVEYGAALLDEDSGQYWNLNPTGLLVVETLLSGGTTDDATRVLADEYGIDPGSAAQDVGELVDQLCSAGLVDE